MVRRELLRMADKTAGRMRKAGLVGRTVTISVRFADFAELTRSATLSSPTWSPTRSTWRPSDCTNGWVSIGRGSAGWGFGSRASSRWRRPACSPP